MRDETKLNSIRWTQEYRLWPQTLKQPRATPRPEPELENLAEARAVLARIMAL